MDGDVIVFITIPFVVMFIVASVAFVVVRFMQHREKMSYARQGMYPPEDNRMNTTIGQAPTPRFRRGVILTTLGIMLTCGFLTIGIGPWLLGGFIPLGLGIAFLIIGWMEMASHQVVINDDDLEDDPIPPGKIQL